MGPTNCGAEEPQLEGETTIVVDSALDRVREMLPRWVVQCLEELPPGVELTTRINPSYLRGDFNGDVNPDYAFLIHRSGLDGLAVCFDGSSQPTCLGAGREFHEMVSLGFDDWSVYPKNPVLRGVEEAEPPTIQSEALFLLWSERASALVYWAEGGFSWYQQGD